VAVLTGLSLLAVACGATGASESSTSTTPTPTPTTGADPSAAAAVVPNPADDGVTRVLFSGDSLMEEIYAAGAAALGDGAETRFLLSPRLIRDSTQEVIWRNVLDDFRPDVVVSLFSHWERLLVGAQTAADFDSIGVDTYAETLAKPFADLVTASGAQLVWISAPPLQDEVITEVYEVMNQAYRTATASVAGTSFVEIGPTLTDENGAYTDILTNAFGAVERVRNTDGIHFCRGGAVRVIEVVLGPLAEFAGASPFWQDGPWLTEPPFELAGCPEI
jgi:hypothetical protein